MSVLVLLEFPVSPDRLDGFRAYLDGILLETRAATGCQSVQVAVQDDPSTVLSVEEWATRADFETYFAWRQETGVLEEVVSHLHGMPVVRFFTVV